MQGTESGGASEDGALGGEVGGFHTAAADASPRAGSKPRGGKKRKQSGYERGRR